MSHYKWLGLLLVLTAGIAAAGDRSGTAWQVRPVVIKAEDLPGLVGSPREKITVMAYDGQAVKPIPFQIDPRDKDGNYVMGTPDKPLAEVAPKGALGADDELVFMAGDAGDKGGIPPEFNPGCEIQVIDPSSNESGWVYAGIWSKGPPPRSKADYVSYKKAPDIEKIITPHYVQTFGPGELMLSDLYITPEGGGNNKDVFDKLKMRSTITAIGGIDLSFDETRFVSELTGLRDGPVRVIRRNETALEFFLGIKTPSVKVDAIFYRDSYEVPSTLKVPFRADLVLSDMTYYQGCDLSHAAGPFAYYSDQSDEKYEIDGKMSEREEALLKIRKEHHWGLVSGDAGSFAYIATWDSPASPIKMTLFYQDDASTPDPPENEPGLAMYGFRLENPLELAKHAYDLNIIVYILPGFDGQPKPAIEALESPFNIKIAP